MAKKLKVLVIRFSAIGDILLTFHVLNAIRNTHPEADIHVLTKAENASIFEGIDVPIVVHSLNQSLYKTARQLQKEHFTHIIAHVVSNSCCVTWVIFWNILFNFTH